MLEQSQIFSAISDGRVENIAPDAPPIQTHISQIFLTKDRAFKFKRAVHLPFVDFSTLEKRHQGCLDEIEANRPLAGAMYVGVQPIISLGNGHYRLGGEGEIVDWVVEMKRFAPGDQFDELASANKLSDELLYKATDVIARAHEFARSERLAGHATDYRGIIRELRETETQGALAQGLKLASPELYDALDHELTRLDHLIETRRRDGKVRRCHGDLHLRNMCLFHGEPVLFDALEFDARLATTDVLYDLAYLLMDLLHLGLRHEANLVMNRYWDMSGETEEALKLLPFFLALRATVRMAVAVAAEKLDEADSYRHLAWQLLAPTSQINLAIGGLSGVGKSTVARKLACRMPGILGARWIRSDILRKQKTAEALSYSYSEASRAAVYQVLRARGKAASDAGISVILDATFQSTGQQQRTVTEDGYINCGIWLTAPLKVRLERVAGRGNDDPSDADIEVASAQKEPYVLPEGWLVISAAGDAEEAVATILDIFGLGEAKCRRSDAEPCNGDCGVFARCMHSPDTATTAA